ncbi:MAG: alpha/beta hydrolase [Acidimicrobiales bacterium]|jgi:acetyl esterase
MPVEPVLRTILERIAALEQPPPSEMTPEEMRASYMAMAAMGAVPSNPPEVQDRTIPGPAGEIPVRVYRPVDAAAAAGGAVPVGSETPPVVAFFHGGGWAIGSVHTHDALCQQLAAQVPAVVVSVDYRLAPEHPFPAGLEDSMAATAWVSEHAAELGADPARLAVAGDSAGGNMSAVISRRARDSGGPPILFQLLVYPPTDLTNSYPSHKENGQGYLLTSEMIDWFTGHYLGDGDRRNPDVSPMCAENLSELPPALVITAEYDPLRDEGEAYAARLADAGVDARLVRYDGMVHGFLQMNGVLLGAATAIADAAGALREALGPTRV